jgi:L-ribulose-5-phosphate 3-epimerase
MSALLLHSMGTPDRDAVGCLDAAADLGLDGIELIVDEEYPSAVSLAGSQSARLSLRHEATARNLRIVALTSYVRGLDDEEEAPRRSAIASLKRTIDIALELGSTCVRVLGGASASDELSFRTATARFGEALHEVGEHVRDSGVSLVVENHMDTLCVSAARTQALVDACHSEAVGVLYDQANLSIMHAEDPAEAVPIMAESIRHLHVKNFVPTATDRIPVGLAHGVVDWADVFSRLQDYDGAITFEYERRWYPELPPPETGLKADRDFLRSLIEHS